jgi:cephalosporin-C deacetylase-like acetyl esterase
MYEEHNRKTGLKINFIRRLSCCVVLFVPGTQYATGRMESKYLLGGRSGVECQRYKNRGTIAGALYRRSAVARALAAILLFVSTLLAQLFAQDAALLRHFDYDQKAPLDVQEAGVEQRGDVTVHDISYASPKGGRVPAYLVVPKGKGPFAAVIWGHWYQDGSPFLNRKEFLDEAVALAGSGVVSLLTDGPIARPGFVRDPDPLGEAQINDRVQQIIDMRRGADLLLARSDVDPKRLAYVGHSYNAATGAFLAGIDKRFKAFVLMAGNLSDQVYMQSKDWQQFRKQNGPEKVDAFVNKYAWLDQGKYVAHAAPASVFLQYATKEDFLTPERAREYFAIISEPKVLKFYEAPHALNAEARRDRIAFLVKELNLKPPDPAAIARIPELVQPPERKN